jgi:hypothetical protein
MKCKYTFFYVVGGQDLYYDQLQTSIKSLQRLKSPFQVKILDIGRKLKSKNNIEIVNTNVCIKDKHVFWQYKYHVCQTLDTEFGIYLDCDTVVCYDMLEPLFNKIGTSFGAIPHFYIQNFKNYLNIFNTQKTKDYCHQHNLNKEHVFNTAGVFLFSNNKICKNILKETFDLHDAVYSNKMTYEEGLYDETFLSTVLKNYHYIKLNGAANHCSANLMPIDIQNDILVGKNPFDADYEPIFVLHGSSKRQKEAQDFSGKLKEKIIEFWK